MILPRAQRELEVPAGPGSGCGCSVRGLGSAALTGSLNRTCPGGPGAPSAPPGGDGPSQVPLEDPGERGDPEGLLEGQPMVPPLDGSQWGLLQASARGSDPPPNGQRTKAKPTLTSRSPWEAGQSRAVLL